MTELIVNTCNELSGAGDVFMLAGTLALDAYDLGSTHFALPEGISYDLMLSHTGDALVLVGTFEAAITTECCRCLEPASCYIDGPVEGLWLFEAPAEEDDLEGDEFAFVGEDGLVDLTPAIISALLLETPQMLTCRDDCRGLCPECGVNLNEGACSCAVDIPDDSPFAALKALKFD